MSYQNKTIQLHFPKDKNKSYCSFEKHNYYQNLNIYFNNDIIFKEINDSEEKLPILLEKKIQIDEEENVLSLFTDINTYEQEEQIDIVIVFKKNGTNLSIIRLNDMENVVNKFDESYEMVIKLNEESKKHTKDWYLNKSYRTDLKSKKTINDFNFSIKTKKPFKNNGTYYDNMILKIL